MVSIAETVQSIEEALVQQYKKNKDTIPRVLLDAMEYTLLSGGKRLRAVLFLTMVRIFGGNISNVMPFAVAIEMIHAYSLIHDDLPALDNDTLRRGKPTNHVVFGEACALLAGDALFADAFYAIATTKAPAVLLLQAMQEISMASGSMGIVGGQVLDVYNTDSSITQESVLAIHAMKTGALFTASCTTGAILAGASEQDIALVREIGQHFGLAFQIVDDILDEVGMEDVLGKSIGKDKESGKYSFVHITDIPTAQHVAHTHLHACSTCLERLTKTRSLAEQRECATLQELIAIVRENIGTSHTA